MRDPYQAHADFIKPAWVFPDPWRVGAVLIGFELAFIATPELIYYLLPFSVYNAVYNVSETALGTTLEFLSFGVTLALFVILVRVFNKRGLQSLLGRGPVGANYLRAGAYVGLALLAVEIAPPFIEWGDIVETRDFVPWLLWLGPALIAITIQSATEEIVYRGYLQQQLAVMSRNKWVWMGIPSILFGAAHYFNGYGPSEGLLWAFWATLLGLACADLTARTGNLGAAIGLHTANNMFAATLVGIEGWPSSGLARHLYAYIDPSIYDYSLGTLLQPWAIFEAFISALGVAVMWLAARLAMRR